MRNEISLTDAEIVEAFNEAFGACALDIDDLTFTRETIQDFQDAAKGYVEAGRSKLGEDGGRATLEMIGVQAGKGSPRYDVNVMDFGTVRAVYK